MPASVVNDEQIVFGHAFRSALRHAAPAMMSPTRPQQVEEQNRAVGLPRGTVRVCMAQSFRGADCGDARPERAGSEQAE